MGVGRAQRDAAAVAGRMAAGKQDDAIEKFDEGLTKLERFETALGKEYERLDELDKPIFAARDRRDGMAIFVLLPGLATRSLLSST